MNRAFADVFRAIYRTFGLWGFVTPILLGMLLTLLPFVLR